MKITLKTNITHAHSIHSKGAVVEFPDELAKSLVARGHAVEGEVPPADETPADPPTKGRKAKADKSPEAPAKGDEGK